MYTSIYIYRIKKENVEDFLAIEHEAVKVYLEHGARFYDVYRASNLTDIYGCLAFPDAMDVGDNEEVLVGLTGFNDKLHHDSSMSNVNEDPRIQDLFARVTRVLRLDRTVRGEFELVN